MDDTLDNAPDLEQPQPLLRLSGISQFQGSGEGGVQTLHRIDLEVAPGDMLALCGPCGSGKTSLLNIMGMLETPYEGNMEFAQLRVSKLSEQGRADLRADMMGFVFQAFTLIPVMNARENVLLPLLLRERLGPAQLQAAYERAELLLAQLGLASHSLHYPQRLDPGQCQRVAIARALITQPRLVLADEPTSRLDSSGTRLVMDLFAREQQTSGTAFVIATRDQRQLPRIKRTVQIADGRLLEDSAARLAAKMQV